MDKLIRTIILILAFGAPALVSGQTFDYPLQIGTRWYFQGQPLADYTPAGPREVIKDTMMSNGKTYAAILYDDGKTVGYQRIHADTVFTYNKYTRLETPLFRFNANEKDTVFTFITARDTTDVILVDTSIYQLYGKARRVFHFFFNTRHMIDEEQTFSIAEGLGWYRIQQSFGYSATLAGAFIGGVRYGTIQTFAQPYYPTTVGNQWRYIAGTATKTIKVIGDTLCANGFRYSILNTSDFAYGKFVRVDPQYVHYYDPVRMSDESVLKLDGKVRDTTTFKFSAFTRSIITAIDTVVLFGEMTRLIHYRLDGIIQQDVTLSEKFGPVGAGLYGDPPPPWPDITYAASGCVIDGWRYGVMTPVKPEPSTPVECRLDQNYPNPFNPSTTISFSIPSRSFVTLRIFDVTGREVAVLASEELPTGSYTRYWNAGDMPSGVYFYRLQAGSFTQTKRLVLLR